MTIAWEAASCWYNFGASALRVLTYTTFNVLENCILTNWVLTVEAILNTLSSLGTAWVNWIVSGFQQEFGAKPVFDAAGTIIASLVYPLTCVCGDLFFVWDYIANVTGDQHLHWALHHAVNVPLDILIQLFTLLFDILTIRIFTPYFGCKPPKIQLNFWLTN